MGTDARDMAFGLELCLEEDAVGPRILAWDQRFFVCKVPGQSRLSKGGWTNWKPAGGLQSPSRPGPSVGNGVSTECNRENCIL